MLGEKRTRQRPIDWKLCTTRHERNQKHRQIAFFFLGKGAGRHDSGNGTAKAHDHGNGSFAGKPDAPERPVQKHRDIRQIAAFRENGKQEKQYGDYRDEGQDASHASADPVHHEGMKDGVYPGCKKLAADALCRRIDEAGKKAAQFLARYIKSQVEDKPHYEKKYK